MATKILTPSFELGEPNLVSAKKRNDSGLCGIHTCDKKLADGVGEWMFLGIRFCVKHSQMYKPDPFDEPWIDPFLKEKIP